MDYSAATVNISDSTRIDILSLPLVFGVHTEICTTMIEMLDSYNIFRTGIQCSPVVLSKLQRLVTNYMVSTIINSQFLLEV
jgi:hypothetical protein